MVSILMCTYNREKYLKQAIESVLNQTYKDFEFVIVDDGSTDKSADIIKAYEDARIKYYALDRNSFYCYAANYGLKHCSGEYVAFMNSDDIWLQDKLEKQIAVMEKNPEYGACFTTVALIDNNNNDVTDEYPHMSSLFEKHCDTQDAYLYELLKFSNFLCHPSAMVRKNVLDKVGGFNLMFRQLADWDLWIRIVSDYPICQLKERLIRFRWDQKGKEQISSGTKEHSVRHFNEEVMMKRHAVERLSDETFARCFKDDFKNAASSSHLELEFEKAFFLADCLKENRELKVLGLEKLEELMKNPDAMQVLREHFGMDIFDLYQWSRDHIYVTPWLKAEYEEKIQKLKETIQAQENMLQQTKAQIEMQSMQINAQEQLIAAYANSTSWKVTEPLRRFTRMFKK